MIDTVVVNAAPGETRVALLAGGRTIEVVHHRAGAESLVGDIFLGRVTKAAPGRHAAFVDIGEGRAGFLNAADARADPDGAVGPIAAHVDEGQAVVVQVARDAIADKGPRLTMRPAFAGRYLVYRPGGRGVDVSRRIAEGAERERLLRLLGDAAGADEGFTLRTAAAGATADDILREAAALRGPWNDALARRAGAAAPARLLRGPGPLERALRDHPDVGRVVIDSPAALAAARGYCRDAVLEAYRGSEPVFERFGVEAALEVALEARVALSSGGALTIEETAALCAIDVDTGSLGGAAAALNANLDAADEIGRQLRLRGIGGKIVIDFVAMAGDARRRRVVAALRAALGGDRDATAPHGFSRLGLVEMRRRRTRPSLGERIGEARGGGSCKSTQTLALDIARHAAHESAAAPPGPLFIAAAPAVAAALGTAVRDALAEAAGRRVEVAAEPSFAHEQHRIDFGWTGKGAP